MVEGGGRGQRANVRGALGFDIDINCVHSAGKQDSANGWQRNTVAEVKLQENDEKKNESQGLQTSRLLHEGLHARRLRATCFHAVCDHQHLELVFFSLRFCGDGMTAAEAHRPTNPTPHACCALRPSLQRPTAWPCRAPTPGHVIAAVASCGMRSCHRGSLC